MLDDTKKGAWTPEEDDALKNLIRVGCMAACTCAAAVRHVWDACPPLRPPRRCRLGQA